MTDFMEIAEQWMRENMPEQQQLPLEQHGSMADLDDPELWRDDFLRWMRERCMHREGCEDWGGMGCLHRDFVEWSISVGELPATQEVFIMLLQADGWQIRNNMVSGLFLKEDLWALEEH